MNRLQKKCVIATAGIHLLLLLILVFGSAFFSPRPRPDDTQLLDVIPANLIDAALNSGVRNATPPAPAPVVTPTPQPTPQPAPLAPAVQPAPQPPAPKAVVTPPPTFMEKVENIFTPEPKSEPARPAPAKAETQPHKIQINTQLVSRVPPKNSTSKPQPNARAINTTLTTLRKNLSSPTEVNLQGDSTVAYANYGDVVVSVYHNAWTPPDGMDSDNVTVQFKITIASDGTVITARIITPSGDASVDAAVQRMLDRVTVIAPFPEGATEKERSYTINFNATRTTE